MRTRSWIGGAFIVAVCAGCPPPGTPLCGAFGDACLRAERTARYIGYEYAQLGVASGGPFDNAGSGMRTRQVVLTVRGAAARNLTPSLDGSTIRVGEVDTTAVPVSERQASAVSVDATIQALPGWRIGPTRIGSLDLGGGVKTITRVGVGLDAASRVGLDIGARVGLVQETPVIPAVSLTASRIYLPALSSSARMATTTGTTMFVKISDIEPQVTVVRASVEKHLGRFALAAGTSKARYETPAEVRVWSSDGTVSDTLAVSSRGSRRAMFVGGSMTLGDRMAIDAELGRLYGGSAPETITRFGGPRNTDARSYLTAGVRVTLGTLRSLR